MYSTYYLSENEVKLIKAAIIAHIHQCENLLKSFSDECEIHKVNNKINELKELLINM